jgi:hypothetical protein
MARARSKPKSVDSIKTPVREQEPVAEAVESTEPTHTSPPPGQSPGRVYKTDDPCRNYREFWGPHDKGAAKPAFCYPGRIQDLQEEVSKMERNLEMGWVSPERKMAYEMRLRQRKERLDSIKEHSERVQNIISKDKDWWVRRRSELGETIRNAMPRRKDIAQRRVNPFKVMKMEKEGIGGKPSLGELKKEYIVISRALGEESNISFLERD